MSSPLTTSYIGILSVETLNSTSCVFFDTDKRRILFNVGEGTQRLCIEHKVRLGKVSHVCLTSFSPELICGLPGLCLTAADAGKTALVVIGPTGTKDFWKSTRHFMDRPALTVDVSEVSCGSPNEVVKHTYEDLVLHCIPVSVPVSVAAPIEERFSTSSVTSPANLLEVSDISYVCEIPPVLGKFDVVKAKELGIPKGPLFGKLKNGLDVTLPDGRVVQSSQVLGPTFPASFVAVIHSISSKDEERLELRIRALTELSYWARFQNTSTSTPNSQPSQFLDCIVHLSPLGTLRHPLYEHWMRSFGQSVTHIAVGAGACIPQTSFVAATKHTNKLATYCPSLFPRLSLFQTSYVQGREGGPVLPVCSAVETMMMTSRQRSACVASPESENSQGMQPFGEEQVSQSGICTGPDRAQGRGSAIIGDGARDVGFRVVRAWPLLRYNLLPRRIHGLSLSYSNPISEINLRRSGTTHFLGWSPNNSKTGVNEKESEVVGRMLGGFCEMDCIDVGEEKLWSEEVEAACNEDVKTFWTEATTDLSRQLLLQQQKMFHIKEVLLAQCDDAKCMTDTEKTLVPKTDVFGESAENSLEDISRVYGLDSSAARSLLADPNNQICFLGTGSAVPSKYRNVTGIWLQLGRGSMLLDAGEGTWDQLIRVAAHSPHIVPGSNEELGLGQGSRADDDWVQAAVARRIALSLCAVWISHPHADHHLGLVTVLTERWRLLSEREGPRAGEEEGAGSPMLVIAPPAVLAFLEVPCSISQLFDPFDNCEDGDEYSWSRPGRIAREGKRDRASASRSAPASVGPHQSGLMTLDSYGCAATITNGRSTAMDAVTSAGMNAKMMERDAALELAKVVSSVLGLGTRGREQFSGLDYSALLGIRNVRVDHCPQAYGVRLDSSSGWSIVYSGDTRPSRRLEELARGTTVLIHEATFSDDKEAEALAKRHSTVGEALAVSRAAGAFRVILTHFSQRYPSMPPLSESGDAGRDTLLAFDLMHVSFRDLLWAPAVVEGLSALFPAADEDAPDEESAGQVGMGADGAVETKLGPEDANAVPVAVPGLFGSRTLNGSGSGKCACEDESSPSGRERESKKLKCR